MFSATITEVSRVELAELNDDFFSTFGDESVTDETSLKEFLRKDIKAYYDNQALQFMYRDIMDALLEKNEVNLPETFLRRYLKESNENVSDEVLENEFDAFAKNMRWSLQKSHLANQFEISVEEADIRKHFTNSVFSYMRSYGNMDYSFISQTVDRLMKDKEQMNKAYEEILADRVFSRIGDTIKKKNIAISQEDFVEKVKQLNERVNNL
jgi:trigger factor